MFLPNLTALSILIILVSCSDSEVKSRSIPGLKQKNNNVSFEIEINEDNYRNTIFGESPQISIWAEDNDHNKFVNIYVTERTWKDDWVGKIHCEVALPFWNRRRKLFKLASDSLRYDIEAVSSATSKNNQISTGIYLNKNTNWQYFIEVNVSGDYNEFYKPFLENGTPDTEGNGQPSIIYSGIINFEKEDSSESEIIGRTHQTKITDSLIENLYGLTTAKNILNKIEIKLL